MKRRVIAIYWALVLISIYNAFDYWGVVDFEWIVFLTVLTLPWGLLAFFGGAWSLLHGADLELFTFFFLASAVVNSLLYWYLVARRSKKRSPPTPLQPGKRRRPRIVLVALVTIVAFACVVPFRSEAWLWVAYREEPLDNGMYLLHKYAPWVSGPEWLFPDQVCNSCVDGRHDECFPCGEMLVSKFREVFYLEYYPEWPNEMVHCTCRTCYPERTK